MFRPTTSTNYSIINLIKFIMFEFMHVFHSYILSIQPFWQDYRIADTCMHSICYHIWLASYYHNFIHVPGQTVSSCGHHSQHLDLEMIDEKTFFIGS